MINLCYGMKVLNITQKSGGSYSHPNGALDLAGADAGIDYWFAQGRWKCIAKWGTANTHMFTAVDDAGKPTAVHCADGVNRIVTIALTHSNMNYIRTTIGAIYENGNPMYQEGVIAGSGSKVTGNHIHLEVAEGLRYSKSYDSKMKVYRMGGELDPLKVFYVNKAFTTVKQDLGAMLFYCDKLEVEKMERRITIGSGECFESLQNGQNIIVYGCPDGYDIGLESAVQADVDASMALQTVDQIDYEHAVNAFKMNAGYFEMQNKSIYGQHYGVEIGYQNEFAPKSTAYLVYAVMNDGSTIVDTADNFWYGRESVKLAVTPALVLYRDGKRVDLESKAYAGTKSVATQQTMLIRTADRFAGAVCIGKLTPAQCAEWASHIVGLRDLIFLDSGGSSSCIGWDVETKKEVCRHLTGRKIANAIVFAKTIATESATSEPIVDEHEEIIADLQKALKMAENERDSALADNKALNVTVEEQKTKIEALEERVKKAVEVLTHE